MTAGSSIVIGVGMFVVFWVGYWYGRRHGRQGRYAELRKEVLAAWRGPMCSTRMLTERPKLSPEMGIDWGIGDDAQQAEGASTEADRAEARW